MPLDLPTVADYCAEVLREVGDPNTTLTPLLTSPTFILWNVWNGRGPINLELQFLYVKKAAIEIRLREEQNDTDFTTESGLQDKQSQRFDHLQTMRDNCQAEIVIVEARLRANRTPVTGALTNVAPQMAPAGTIDPNDPALRGSPFRRSGWPW